MSAQERLGAELLAHRLLRGMGQKNVAHRAGISISHLSLIEHGHRSASLNVLNKVAEAVGCAVVIQRTA